MTIQRAMFPAWLFLASACVRTPAATEIAPKLGPEGSIRALYDGGLLHRNVSALFSVEQSSYVLAAHLGGDGIIRVVYPSDARRSAWVTKGEIRRTPSFTAYYDGAPGFYFMATSAVRSAGARNYSYDGRGHGFVFMITSRRPFRVDRISDFGLWDEVEVRNYHVMLDPRVAVRQFADLVTDGTDYSIEYAHSFTTYAFRTYADAMLDCAMLNNFTGLSPYWLYGVTSTWWQYPMRDYCGYGSYGYRYAYGYRNPYGYNGYNPVPSRTPILPPVTEPVAQRTPRPTFTPTIPTERRAPARRGDNVVAYKPTWADNPSFAPAPSERRSSPRRAGAGYNSPRPTDERRRTSDSPDRSRGSSSGTSVSSGTPSPSSQPASTPAPTPTMSPGRGSSSEPSRRPPNP